MLINPMTGQLYNYATNGPPIGLGALDQRPASLKALDVAMGGGPFLMAVKYRSHRTLINEGEYKNSWMQRGQMKGWFDKSYERSAENPSSWRNILSEQFRDTLTKVNPFSWGRAPSMGSMDPETARTEYAISNWALKHSGALKSKAFQEGGFAHDLIDENGNLKHAFDPNFTSRIGAGAKWDRKALKEDDRALTADERATVESYLEKANPKLLERLKTGGWMDGAKLSDASAYTRMGMSKTVTGRVGGYIQSKVNPDAVMSDSPLLHDAEGNLTAAGRGYMSGQAGTELADKFGAEGMEGMHDIAGKSAEELTAKGLGKEAAERFAMKSAASLAARAAAERVGMFVAAQAIPIVGEVVDVATLAYIAYKGAKIMSHLSQNAVKGGISLAAGAVTSFEGDIKKPQFGMGYHDTFAAATSRSRGVAAIQHSRLNARSVLGSEASSIHSYFG